LLNGHFDYVDSGILERTHLRFFTYATLLKLVSAIEMYPELICFLRRDPLTAEIPLAQHRVGFSDLLRLGNDEYSMIYQFLLVLKQGPTDMRIERFGPDGSGLAIRYYLKRLARLIRKTG
jgi:hypothetical protein